MTRAEGVWLWLSMTQGVSTRIARQLVEFFGGEEELWQASEEQLVNAVGGKIANALLASRSGKAVNEHVRLCAEKGIYIVTPASEEYPRLLLEIEDPPCALYAKGNLSLLKTDCLTVIGTRRHTRYGKSVTEKLAGELAAAGLTIVSTLGEGLDAAAHRAALDAGGNTIAVLANGVDVSYPAVNFELQAEIERRGLIISEYPPGQHGSAGAFSARNRILAGISGGVLVPEAGKDSGTLLTCGLAMEGGREVFVVPGNIDSPASYATNRLMRTSAEIVLESQDILDRFGIKPKEKGLSAEEKEEGPKLDDEERSIVFHLQIEEQSFDELIALTGFSAAKLNSLLTMLQLKGIIDQSAGRVYAMKR